MVECAPLQLRKVGVTVATRLETWRRRGWTVVEAIAFGDEPSLRTAERLALTRLDQMSARSTPHMKAVFSNLADDGRTEMYDPIAFDGNLSRLLGADMGTDLGDSPALPPSWISDPRRHAAQKAWTNGKLALKRSSAAKRAAGAGGSQWSRRSAAARRAWVTRRGALDAAGMTQTAAIATAPALSMDGGIEGDQPLKGDSAHGV